MRSLKAELLAAAKADSIPEGNSGLWYVHRANFARNILGRRDNRLVEVPAGKYAYLYRLTAAKMHQDPPGDLVMHDTPDELKTHLQFMLRARGKVLITGLGLGCVARGCLANPAVEHVTVIENCVDVLNLVASYMPSKRLTIVYADALEWCASGKRTREFDFAWHDLWSDPDDEKATHLQVLHSRLIRDCAVAGLRKVGAWAFPKKYGRLWLQRNGIGI